jgi:hypothetical protein
MRIGEIEADLVFMAGEERLAMLPGHDVQIIDSQSQVS